MRPHAVLKVALVTCLVVASIMLAGPSAFGQGRPPGAGGGGGGGGHTESAVNNLSYPAVMIAGTVANPGAIPLESDSDILGTTYTYGCDTPQMIGTTTYPNYSCLALDGTALTALECAALGACAGKTVSRIYKQKINTSYWKAQETPAPSGGVTVQYLDWGDNLESKSWTVTSTIRVETTLFKDHVTDPILNDVAVPKRGYQMWHVSGQGTDEVWGVRAAFEGVEGTPPTAVYAYDSSYSIIKTTLARLNISKLVKGEATCPTAYQTTPFLGDWTGGGWTNACTLKDEAYTAELNVGGKYVYGYNWAIRRDALNCTGWTGTSMAGWWRLTFYTPGTFPAVIFDKLLDDTHLAPPTLLLPPTPTSLFAASAAAESETGTALYWPVVDPSKNLTYIDICITSGGGGGGKK